MAKLCPNVVADLLLDWFSTRSDEKLAVPSCPQGFV